MDGVNETDSLVSGPATSAEPSGFEEFFRREHARLLRALYLLTGSEQEAEELSQEALLKVWERWERVAVMDRPTGYLYRTAMNAFRSRYRRAARTARRILARRVPVDEIRAAEERDAVMRSLATLSPRQRAALVLTELLGYGSEEAAAMLDVKPVTVRVLASQARSALRERLERDDE